VGFSEPETAGTSCRAGKLATALATAAQAICAATEPSTQTRDPDAEIDRRLSLTPGADATGLLSVKRPEREEGGDKIQGVALFQRRGALSQ